MIDGILEIIPTIFQTVAEEASILLAGSKPRYAMSEFDKVLTRTDFKNLKQGNLFFISVILDLQANSVIKNRMVNYPFIRSIASLIDVCEPDGFAGADEFLKALLLIVESVSAN